MSALCLQESVYRSSVSYSTSLQLQSHVNVGSQTVCFLFFSFWQKCIFVELWDVSVHCSSDRFTRLLTTSQTQSQPPQFASSPRSGVWLVSPWSAPSGGAAGWRAARPVEVASLCSLSDCRASLWVSSSDDSNCPFRGRRLWEISVAVCAGGGSDGSSGCVGALEGEEGGVSVPLLQSSVECVSLVSGCVSSADRVLSLVLCVTSVWSLCWSVSAGSGCSGVGSPESSVWQRPRGRSLSRGPASRLAEGLLTSTVSPRLNLLLSGFTWQEKSRPNVKFVPREEPEERFIQLYSNNWNRFIN